MKESQYKSRPSFTFAWLGLVDRWRLLFSSSAEQMFTEDILVFLLPELPLFTCWSQLTFFWLIQDSWQFGHKYRKLAKASEIFHKVLSFTPEAEKRKGKIRKKRGKRRPVSILLQRTAAQCQFNISYCQLFLFPVFKKHVQAFVHHVGAEKPADTPESLRNIKSEFSGFLSGISDVSSLNGHA